ncbi:hypothetical protein C2G38_2199096 [Gigaspora rosea]|uniref:DNA helicase n=1 Tax=Gigaspora rosea TaxID=44941 RepID=A0A397UW98_9GLOM|nr:hypothetical protein C2G38_2199096 [Gigaspora rosea]
MFCLALRVLELKAGAQVMLIKNLPDLVSIMVKRSVQLPSRKASIITPSSSIIILQHVAEISSWIDRCSPIYNDKEILYEFKLLLRGSKDGFTGETFHRLCDECVTTADSFIFSLKNGNIPTSFVKNSHY